MRYLLILILLLFSQYDNYSQYYSINSDSLIKPIINKTYLNFYFEDIDSKQKTVFIDFNFTPMDINQIQSDSIYNTESVFNYGLGFDYNYNIDNNEMIDFLLVIDTSLSNLSLNCVRFSIIFYF